MTARRKVAGEVAEAHVVASDEAAQERGAGAIRAQRIARTYVQAKHPDTGLPVTFVPGEALPDWVPGD